MRSLNSKSVISVMPFSSKLNSIKVIVPYALALCFVKRRSKEDYIKQIIIKNNLFKRNYTKFLISSPVYIMVNRQAPVLFKLN